MKSSTLCIAGKDRIRPQPCTIDVQDRGYVTREGRSLRVSSSGRVLSAFLTRYFNKYVNYDFTSSVEESLDEVSGEHNFFSLLATLQEDLQLSEIDKAIQVVYQSLFSAAAHASWKEVLENFWEPFNRQLKDVKQIGVRGVIDELDSELGPHLFPLQVNSSTKVL